MSTSGNLGTLVLRLKTDRTELRTGLEQAEAMGQEYSSQFRASMGGALKLKFGVDESSLNGAMAP